jgi:hypothetical protein
MLNKNLSRFQRRSLQLFSSSLLLTAGLTFFTHQYFRHQQHSTTGPLAWFLSVLPALPFLALMFICLRYLSQERDEYIRAQVLLALLQGSFITMGFTVIYAFLQNYLDITDAPAMFYVDIFLIASMFALRYHLRQTHE